MLGGRVWGGSSALSSVRLACRCGADGGGAALVLDPRPSLCWCCLPARRAAQRPRRRRRRRRRHRAVQPLRRRQRPSALMPSTSERSQCRLCSEKKTVSPKKDGCPRSHRVRDSPPHTASRSRSSGSSASSYASANTGSQFSHAGVARSSLTTHWVLGLADPLRLPEERNP